ncbi:MAG TPA: type II secretion system protein [Patescibacteria group bacterium]|nr:type II secretion system protein [Patescibacteria group bacterium]
MKFFSGQTLIELVLAMGLAAIIFPALLTGFVTSREGRVQQEQRLQAITLLKETEQAVRAVRKNDWASFAVDGIYHPVVAGSTWQLASNTIDVNGFTQQILVSSVNRNTNGDIVTIGGMNDPSTKRVAVTISWSSPYASSVTSTMYLTRSDNVTYSEDSDDDFNDGTLTDTQVTADLGGEIKLANNNKGKWCSPSFSSATIDLPDGPPVAVAATASATSIDIPNEAFVATSPETTNSIKLAYVRIDANTDTPAATLSGKFTLDAAQYSDPDYVPTGIDLNNSFITKDVKYYRSSGNNKYALLATNLPDKEIIAVLIDDNNPANDDDTTGEYADPTNNIFKYWTFFNTRMYAGASQPVTNTGLLDPSSNAAETSNAGDNDGYGSNPNRAYTNNNSFAVDTNSGSGTGTSCTGTDKDKHQYYDYNIPSLPTGATINGIEIRLDARVDSTSGSPQICVQLSWDGGSTWTTEQSTSTLSTSEQTYTLGGSSDTWGRTWSESELNNSNFRVRVINVSSNTSRDFSLDWAATRVYYTTANYDQAPYDYGVSSLSILNDRGYAVSGGYLYVFDLSTIDSKSTSSGLDMIGCRIQLDGYDCRPGSPATAEKYDPGESGASWGDDTSAIHDDCSDGGNIELHATNDIDPVQVGGSTYVFVAIGGVTNPEFGIVNATSVPDGSSSPSLSNSSCGRISGGNSGWKRISTYDFNSGSGTEEAANSVFARSDGNRAYITSNGGADSEQYYILNTSNQSSPSFLSGSPSSGPTSGYYNASGANGQLYPRRALTVQNGVRAVLVGDDGVSDSNDAEEYQVLDNSDENTPAYCGGLDFDDGFNDLTSVSELDGDNYVYMVSNTINNDLKIIQGGPDNAIYISSGTYESPTFDSDTSGFPQVAFNGFQSNVDVPVSTSLQMQVASAPSVSGSCSGASFSFVGPNGDPDAYFTPVAASVSGTIPFGNYLSDAYQNPGRCFRYRAELSTSDQTKTPVLYDTSINYSP